MYELYLDGKPLYYPGDTVNAITSGNLKRKLNESGTLNISVPLTNPCVSEMRERVSEVCVKRDGVEIWNGEIRQIKNNMRNEKSVCVVGELSYLGASSQPQMKYFNRNPGQVFAAVVAEHNRRVELRKRFNVGIISVENKRRITTWITNYDNTLDFLRNEMCEKLDACLRIRKVGGVRFLDLVKLSEYGKTCQQAIEFGENLLDYTSDTTADAIVTVCRPIGAKIKVEGDAEKTDFERYTTIETVNDGSDYIVNQTAVDSGIGMVWETVEFKDITDPTELKEAGEDWLKNKQFSDLGINVTAVDLSRLNSSIDSFELGDAVPIVAKPFGLDKWSYITEENIDLLKPTTKNNLTISEKVKMSYTQQANMINGEILREMPKQQIILELAKESASQIIKSATEGNIYFVNDDNGIPKELLIMDTNNIETAQRVWRWNLNGLGYSSNGYNGTFRIAMTMDGRIVADFITGGVIRGVEFNNGDGTFHVDEEGNVVANSFSSNNVKITGGELDIDLKDDISRKIVKISSAYGSDEYYVGIGSNSIRCHRNSDYTEVTSSGVDIGTFSGDVQGDGTYTPVISINPIWSIMTDLTVNGDLEVNGTCYTTSGTVSTSDKDTKNSIKELDAEQSSKFIYSLKPCKYKYNNGTSDRFHHGLIAQDVKESMDEDWGVYIDATPDEDGGKGLRYEELIADLIGTVKLQNERIKILEERMSASE